MKRSSRNFVANNGRMISGQTLQDYRLLFHRYGDRETSLKLSPTAEKVLSETSNINIFEVAIDVSEDYYSIDYVLSYILVADLYQVGVRSAEDINEWLEGYGNELKEGENNE